MIENDEVGKKKRKKSEGKKTKVGRKNRVRNAVIGEILSDVENMDRKRSDW